MEEWLVAGCSGPSGLVVEVTWVPGEWPPVGTSLSFPKSHLVTLQCIATAAVASAADLICCWLLSVVIVSWLLLWLLLTSVTSCVAGKWWRGQWAAPSPAAPGHWSPAAVTYLASAAGVTAVGSVAFCSCSGWSNFCSRCMECVL